MLLPGPEAQQLATYIGWLMHGLRGGLIAGTLFILPGAISILGLSLAYALYRDSGFVQALFFGLKPAVLAIVIEAVMRIGKRVLKNRVMYSVAGVSFVARYFFDVPFPMIVLVAGLIGYWGGRAAPQIFLVLKGHGSTGGGDDISGLNMTPAPASWGRSLRVSVVCLTLWFGPLLALYAWTGPQSVYLQQGVFFSKAAVVTFGGAYAVLAYVTEVAEKYGWLKSYEVPDGLAMAETTPGPLIMVVQFVAFVGAYRHADPLGPIAGGILASVVTTWVTFVPCFYWIFLGAPYIERLRGNKSLTAALSTITAAVVGVVLYLAVWMTRKTLFRDESLYQTGPWGMIKLAVPTWSSLNWGAVSIALVALLLTFRFKRGMVLTLSVCVLLGIGWWLWGPR